MRLLLKRLLGIAALATLVVLAGCSSLGLAYSQLPRLAGWWADAYLDLDGPQERRLDAGLRSWQDWHRREELPQWLALLRQAGAALDQGVGRDELLALEQAARASAERCLQQAAPLVAPLLAGLRPAQWQHLQGRLDEKLADWQEAQAGAKGVEERAERYADSLARWLGPLDRATRRQARADAHGWPVDLPALAAARAARQARTVEALQAWSRHELAEGNALLMGNMLAQPAELALREATLASLLKLLNGLDAAGRERVRAHWAGWAATLQAAARPRG